MEYIPILLAFFASLIALIGNTWDKEASGIQKLTLPGRFTFALVVFSLIYSFVSVYQQRDQKQHEELEKKKLGNIIKTEISMSLSSIASPFRHLYMENSGGNYIPENDISFDSMLTESMLRKSQDTCLNIRPKTFYSVPDRGTWKEIFVSDIRYGIERLERLVDRYGVAMNAEMLSAIHDLQVNGYFSKYAHIEIHRNIAKESKTTTPNCLFRHTIGTYRDYLTMLKRIELLNDFEKLVH